METLNNALEALDRAIAVLGAQSPQAVQEARDAVQNARFGADVDFTDVGAILRAAVNPLIDANAPNKDTDTIRNAANVLDPR
jgi:hypothetical protein